MPGSGISSHCLKVVLLTPPRRHPWPNPPRASLSGARVKSCHHADELGQITCLHPLHHPRAMNFDRARAYTKTRGDLLVCKTCGRKLHDLSLPFGETVRASSQVPQVGGIVPGLSSVAHSCPDAFQEALFVKRLLNEIKRTQLDRPNCHLDIPVSRDQDDRNGDVSRGHFPNEINAREAGHSNVRYNAVE